MSEYKCKAKRLYYICIIDYEYDIEEYKDKEGEFIFKVITPHIYLNVLEGTARFHTLRVIGKVDKHSLFIMVDFESTYDFISTHMAKTLQRNLKPIKPLT